MSKALAFIFALVLLHLDISSGSEDGCLDRFPRDHTMCLYKSNKKGCETVAMNADTIVKAHNGFRRRVAKGEETRQPAATNMRKLVWSDKLAAVAQRWAQQCTEGSDKERKDISFSYVGQNTYHTVIDADVDLSKFDWRVPVQSWYDEEAKFDNDVIPRYRIDDKYDSYAQLVWADTDRVGCGAATAKGESGNKRLYVVCNYGEGGNVGDAKVYTPGDACSQCPSSTSCDDSLCA